MKVVHLDNVEKEIPKMEGASGIWKQIPISKRDGSPLFCFRVFTFEPGGHTPFHRHPNEHLNYVIRGKGAIVAEDGEEREIAAVTRKVARKVASGNKGKTAVDKGDIQKLLGAPRFSREALSRMRSRSCLLHGRGRTIQSAPARSTAFLPIETLRGAGKTFRVAILILLYCCAGRISNAVSFATPMVTFPSAIRASPDASGPSGVIAARATLSKSRQSGGSSHDLLS